MIPDYVRLEARKELARRQLYEYCKLKYPNFYRDDRTYLKEMCNEIQSFLEQDKDKFLVINLPPRHGKSFTATNTVEWLFGLNPSLRVMTGSYNETLSSSFAKQVRDTIAEEKVGERLVYNDIFPDTKIKYGEATINMWALKNSPQKSYLATSPTGTATGFGANVLIVDDLIKNVEEAYNDNVLQKHWDWFTNTMLSRLEGDWKVIIIMTRWAIGDLAGRVLENYSRVRHITYKAYDGEKMLCDDILSHDDYLLKTQEMNADIVEANYNQVAIEVKGRLYGAFKVWEVLPPFKKKYTVIDTADEGSDYLCAIAYIEYDKEAYVTDVIYTQAGMEITEVEVVDMLWRQEVHECEIESNSGGRGFARNVERIMKDKYNTNRTVIKPRNQSANKKSRIITASGWVTNHIYMPLNWNRKFPEFYRDVTHFMKEGRNQPDDGPDVLSRIYEKITAPKAKIILSDTRIY